MPHITVNPQAEADAGFEIAQPGVYRMRIEGATNFPAVQEFTSAKGNTCLKVRMVFADPTSVTTDKNTVAKNLGSIVDSGLVVAPAEKQGKLRSLVEACSLPWADFDTDQLVGKELQAKVAIEEYNGTKRNNITRYLKPGA